jgi:heme-degrading monooxygenase HmoA
MKRSSATDIRDPRVGAVIASAWTLDSEDSQRSAAAAALSAMPETLGLLRFSLFRGVDDLTLFLLSQWTDEPSRDAYIAVSAKPRAVVDETEANIQRDWRHPARLYRSFIGGESAQLGCLVVVQQLLNRADPQAQRHWVDTAVTALESQAEPAPGLSAASFFLSADGGHILNLAEWQSADAHRAWLSRDEIGETSEWQALLSHPGAAPGSDVRRYEFFGAVEAP